MYKDILLTVDLNDEASKGKPVETAIEMAQAFGSKLHIMTVVPEFGFPMVSGFFPDDYEAKAMAATDGALHEFVKKTIPEGIDVQHIVAHGGIYEEVMRVSQDVSCDLIIMGAHRPKTTDFLLGPNAARVVRFSDKAVLVVRN